LRAFIWVCGRKGFAVVTGGTRNQSKGEASSRAPSPPGGPIAIRSRRNRSNNTRTQSPICGVGGRRQQSPARLENEGRRDGMFGRGVPASGRGTPAGIGAIRADGARGEYGDAGSGSGRIERRYFPCVPAQYAKSRMKASGPAGILTMFGGSAFSRPAWRRRGAGANLISRGTVDTSLRLCYGGIEDGTG